MIETNQEKEARVFAKFAEVAGLLERGAEFELKDPPHPDILMTGLPEGDIAFELVELVSESVAKIGPTLESISEELHQQFDEIDSTIKNQIYEKFADAVIFVRFSRKVNKNKRLQIYPKLFDFLLSADINEGYLQTNESLKNFMNVSIYRGKHKGPIFTTSWAGFIANPIEYVLSKKINKTYETSADIHLLAFIEMQQMLPKQVWLNKTIRFLNNNFKKSYFETIWIFDTKQNCIILKWTCPN